MRCYQTYTWKIFVFKFWTFVNYLNFVFILPFFHENYNSKRRHIFILDTSRDRKNRRNFITRRRDNYPHRAFFRSNMAPWYPRALVWITTAKHWDFISVCQRDSNHPNDQSSHAMTSSFVPKLIHTGIGGETAPIDPRITSFDL